jgi:hypothetical protein
MQIRETQGQNGWCAGYTMAFLLNATYNTGHYNAVTCTPSILSLSFSNLHIFKGINILGLLINSCLIAFNQTSHIANPITKYQTAINQQPQYVNTLKN